MLKKVTTATIRLASKRACYFSKNNINRQQNGETVNETLRKIDEINHSKAQNNDTFNNGNILHETERVQQAKDSVTDFGYKEVYTKEKQNYVNEVFHSVANNYDVMNDFMSLGIHRYWKDYFVDDIGHIGSSKSFKAKTSSTDSTSKESKSVVLDVAGGTGDIAFKILDRHRKRQRSLHGDSLKVKVLDVNTSMLQVGASRAQNRGFTQDDIEFIEGNAEDLHQIESESIDVYTIAFGIRNVPRKEQALKEAHRVLKKGGRFVCLEFSKVQNPVFSQIYSLYSFNVIPLLGQIVANDRQSYQYLVESIEKFYDQETFLRKMKEAGFSYATYKNLTDGIVAIHSGFKLE